MNNDRVVIFSKNENDGSVHKRIICRGIVGGHLSLISQFGDIANRGSDWNIKYFILYTVWKNLTRTSGPRVVCVAHGRGVKMSDCVIDGRPVTAKEWSDYRDARDGALVKNGAKID